MDKKNVNSESHEGKVHDIKTFLSCNVPFKAKMSGCKKCRQTPEEQKGIDSDRPIWECEAKRDYFEVRRKYNEFMKRGGSKGGDR